MSAAKSSAKLSISEQLRPAPGFTLIELMITISIAAILLAIGIPSMRDMILQNRLSGNVNEFIAANMLARSEAIKRGSPVTLCRSVGAGDWNTGWTVRAVEPDASVTVLMRQAALAAGTTVTSTLKAISYTCMGQPVLAATGDSTSFTFSNDCRLEGRNVVISRSGHASVETIDPAGC